jgi:hypothetical protein
LNFWQKIRSWLSGKEWLALIGVMALVSGAAYPIYYHRIMTPVDNDFGSHILFAQRLLMHEPMPVYTVVHPLFQVIIGGIYWLSRSAVGLWDASILVMVLALAAQAAILFVWLRKRAQAGIFISMILPVVVTFAAPLMLLAGSDGQYYYGYIGLANYHNPTVVLLRPLALASFLLGIQVFEGRTRHWGLILFSAVILIASALVKPNFALSLLPAICLLAGWYWLQRRPVDWTFLFGGFILPGVAVLFVQGLFSFFSPEAGQGSIIFAPFQVEQAFSGWLGLKFVLSLIFPLTVLIVYFKQIRNDPAILLAWIGFCVGAFQMYFLAESNDRFFDGNFRWSAQIMLYVLFAASAYAAGRYKGTLKQRWPVWLAAAAQLAAGAVYYAHLFQVASYR